MYPHAASLEPQRHGAFGSDRLPHHTEPGLIFANEADTRDSDVYGVPEKDKTNVSSMLNSEPFVQEYEDDKPLGKQNKDIQAVHERIIERERQAQKDKTLSKLEGRAPSSSISADARTNTNAAFTGSAAILPRARSTRAAPSMADLPERSNFESFPLRRSRTMGQASKQLLRSATSRYRARSPPYIETTSSTIPLSLPSTVQNGSTSVSSTRTRAILSPSPPPYSPPYPTFETNEPFRGVGYPGSPNSVNDVTHAMGRMAVQPHSTTRLVSYRVFVLNVQRYTVINVPEDALTRQMLQATVTQMNLAPVGDPVNDWAVFDVLPDLGIERPVREYERIRDVVSARGNDAGYFLVKVTEWSMLLRADDVPVSSAALAGWVSMQNEPRKWTKRWLELREHALFTASSESGKHTSHLCSMVDVDLYLIDYSRSALSKPYGFALRRVALDESVSRTVAYITQPDPAAHRDWVKSIVGAHTYILRQEAPELFAAAKGLRPVRYMSPPSHPVRRHTYKEPSARRVRSHRQLKSPNAAPLIPTESLSVQFQEGSLLAERERAEAAHRSHPPRGPPI